MDLPADAQPLVVTRHPALVTVLVEDGIVPAGTPVLSHAVAADVAGRHVYGVLPLSLAATADRVTVINLQLPAELRGQELTAEQIRHYRTGTRTYRVSVEWLNHPKEKKMTPKMTATAALAEARTRVDCFSLGDGYAVATLESHGEDSVWSEGGAKPYPAARAEAKGAKVRIALELMFGREDEMGERIDDAVQELAWRYRSARELVAACLHALGA